MMSCGKKLAPGLWWNFCGETDMGQTEPALCADCAPNGYPLAGAAPADVDAYIGRRNAAFVRWQGAGYVGDLFDYWQPVEPCPQKVSDAP